jgi:hypothetical protein
MSAFMLHSDWRNVGRTARVWPGGDAETVDSVLAEAGQLVDAMEAERNRVADELSRIQAAATVEGVALRVFSGTIGFFVDVNLDPLALQERADSFKDFIAVLEDFAARFDRVAQEARANNDLDRARKLRDSARKILGAAKTATPARDLSNDAKAAASSAVDELKTLIDRIVKAVGIGTALYIGVQVVKLITGR